MDKPKKPKSPRTTGRANGGVARAEALTPAQKTLIAKKAAAARWANKPRKAIRMGNFKEEFGIDVDCYVLDDNQKTAVISQRGMGAALGLGESGGRLPRFVSGKTISAYVGPDLREKLENPLVFQASVAGPNIPATQVNGYDVTILIDLCKVIVAAEVDGKLLKSQEGFAKQAHVILAASAKAGIKGLVYALSGYDATREEIITAFKQYVQQEAREYEKEFPPQLYNEWYRLYNIPKFERGRPWEFKNLTLDHVYHPLARSNGKVLEMARSSKAQSGESNRKLHQFLSEIGTKVLRTHLGQLLGIARISKNSKEYERHVKILFGDQRELDLE
ncbi:P63C domain-containing protein [Burkholderia gladioli]|uniref:P63C domain-containing protein n=1 Tax=Burkholderia gladioli TaxID=28095 RepID=UPI0016410EE1|nr:P63C domain-containing protein [Burkholderia gladioli]